MKDNINLVIVQQFIDAFYSFDRERLKTILTHAQNSQPNLLYYQKWAECGNYKVLKVHDYINNDNGLILCPITVEDDLMSALGIDFNVTDTFHISIKDGIIKSVETSSDDPDLYYEAKEWVMENRPDLVKVACKDIWNGGPTPCECIKGMLQGFVEFRKSREVLGKK